MQQRQSQPTRVPAFSKVGVRAAGIAVHSSNHATVIAMSAWK
jgi:hypothetical protein